MQGPQMAPGTSGNPAGKPRGTPHKATRCALALRSGEAEGLARKAVELALAATCAVRSAPWVGPPTPRD
jgi:hypothetical protein